MANHTTGGTTSVASAEKRAALIDVGINLAHRSFTADRDAVLERARAAGVVQMVITGSDAASTREAISLAKTHPQRLFATAGVHPHHAQEWSAEVASEMRALACAPEVVAVGECGLDYFRNLAPRAIQRATFHRQLELAVAAAKPAFLHQRDAHADFVAILREHQAQLSGAVAHCFTGNSAELDCYLQMQLSIGITGWICDERRGAHLLPLMREIPAQQLLLESDAPYLVPRDLRPRPAAHRNEPAFLPHIAAAVARARGEPLAELARQTTLNARRFFGLPIIH